VDIRACRKAGIASDAPLRIRNHKAVHVYSSEAEENDLAELANPMPFQQLHLNQ
jgi:hypothetical protein